MTDDDDDEHPVQGKISSYLPADLGLNLDVEVDEQDHGCQSYHNSFPLLPAYTEQG